MKSIPGMKDGAASPATTGDGQPESPSLDAQSPPASPSGDNSKMVSIGGKEVNMNDAKAMQELQQELEAKRDAAQYRYISHNF